MGNILSTIFFILQNVIPFLKTAIDYYKKRKIKLILGGKDLNNMILTFPSFGVINLRKPPQNDEEALADAARIICFFQIPSQKKAISQTFFRVFPIVSLAEIRSISYLNSLLNNVNITPQIKPDFSEIVDEDNSNNLISFGLFCTKSMDIINDNPFIELKKPELFGVPGNFTIKGLNISFQNSEEHSYAIIIRKTLVENNTRIVCAGFDEWGTSGAAYCLAKQHEIIYNSIKSVYPFRCYREMPDFLCIIEAVREYDEKAQIHSVWIQDNKLKNSLRKIYDAQITG